jgi:hypothetical protein
MRDARSFNVKVHAGAITVREAQSVDDIREECPHLDANDRFPVELSIDPVFPNPETSRSERSTSRINMARNR